jgi:hypothetical protein
VTVGKIILGTFVKVDSGVNVLLRVGEAVKVGGIASSVLVNAASDVCTIIVLIACGSSGGTGVTAAGTHAIINMRVMHQMKNFLGDFVILQRSL